MTISFGRFCVEGDEKHHGKFEYVLSGYRVPDRKKAMIVCPTHGIFQQLIHAHLKGNGCRKCKYEKHGNLLRTPTSTLISEGVIIHDNVYEYPVTEYLANGKLPILCKTHGIFEKSYYKHIKCKQGCPKCSIDEQSALNYKTHQEFLDEANLKHHDGYEYLSKYVSCFEKVEIKCKKCSSVFNQTPASHLFGAGCPKCAFVESKGEKKISYFLITNNIKHERQKWFSDCRGKKRPLPFDFYLPDFNAIIEFDGEQHYRPKNFKGALSVELMNKAHETTKRYDLIKNTYCSTNNIPILRIPYTEINNINTLVSDFIESLKEAKICH